MPAISLVLITFNEAHNLQRALNNCDWADEVIVVDSGSTDGTVQLAEQLGAKVHHKVFNGFGEQKHYAVSLAKNDWVFLLDADEEFTNELAQELHSFAQSAAKISEVGFWVPRHFFFLGKLLRFGGQYGNLQLRLFNKQHGNYNLAKVHERPMLSGEIGNLKGAMIHYSYQSLHQYFAKFNEYTSAGASEVLAKNKLVRKWKVVFRFPISFIQLYIIKGLILDGYPGFIWALFSSLYPVVKYAKAIEMQKERKNGAK